MAANTHNKALLMGFVADVAVPPSFRERYGTPEDIQAKLEADYARIRRAGITPVIFLFDTVKQEKALQDFENRSTMPSESVSVFDSTPITRLYPRSWLTCAGG
ncbi:hypothetical protein GGS21DRAFT_511884 [Xylaria nigripes]|nr:hypothetical protein GGS21DRAFT_511884 [Xylaria nigripes]